VQRVFSILIAATSFGCAGAAPVVVAPPEEGLPLRFAPRAAREATPFEVAQHEPEPEPPDHPASPCPLQLSPHELRFSVFTLSAELHGRMMVPLYRALCACTRPGQSLLVVARAVPERGELRAATAERTELGARPSRSIDACLMKHLDGARFEPFTVGSDVVCDPPPPRPAPRNPSEPVHFMPPRRVGYLPDEEKRSQLTLPLHVDRRTEAPTAALAGTP
jgi:hypothetical protein